MPDGPPPAWLVALLGVWVLASAFVFGAETTHTASLVIAGALVAILAAYRGMYADEDVPLPALPLAIVILGVWLVVDPFVLGSGTETTLGLSTIVAGIIIAVIPAVMIVQLIREGSQEASAA